MLEFIIILAYFLCVVAIGLASRRKHWKLDDFFVAGRRYSVFFIAGSLLATIIGGSATVGLAGLGFSQGLTGAWWLLVGTIGLIALGVFFAKKVRDFGLYTLPELVEKQYGPRVGVAASILILIAWIGVTAGQIVAAGKILGMLGLGSPTLWMVIFTVIFVGYTMAGGQFAIIRTDILDIVIIFVGIFAGLAVLVWHLGGVGGLLTAISGPRLAFPLSSQFGGANLLTYVLIVGLTYVVGPDMYSRLFCAKDSQTAQKSVFWAALLLIPFAFGITLIGMGAFALFPQISPEQAFPTLIKGIMPPVIGGLVLAALVSAVMSSADATLLSASTILSVDIIGKFRSSLGDKKVLLLSRWGILVLGVAALGLGLLLNGVITALLFAYTVYTCGVILPVIFGFYRTKLKITSNAALIAIIGGGCAALVNKIWGIKYLDLGGLAVSLVLLIAVSTVENRIRSARRSGGHGIAH
jgi:solute:Na+ symporter, SSS family